MFNKSGESNNWTLLLNLGWAISLSVILMMTVTGQISHVSLVDQLEIDHAASLNNFAINRKKQQQIIQSFNGTAKNASSIIWLIQHK